MNNRKAGDDFKMGKRSGKFTAEELIKDNEVLGLDGVAQILENIIQLLSDKIEKGRITDFKKLELLIKMIKTLTNVSKVYADIKQVQKVEDLERKMEILEKNLEKEDK